MFRNTPEFDTNYFDDKYVNCTRTCKLPITKGGCDFPSFYFFIQFSHDSQVVFDDSANLPHVAVNMIFCLVYSYTFSCVAIVDNRKAQGD